MTRWISKIVMAAAVGVLLPGSALAGAMLKEHECVGKDTALDLSAIGEDANCTPIGSEIAPPGGDEYDMNDVDESFAEGFQASGALEVLPQGSNVWQTIPTIKEPGFQQVGFPATASYAMLIKSSQILSDIEVTCSVCAERPQGLGSGQTFVSAFDLSPIEEVTGGAEFVERLNIAQEPWRMSVSHSCRGPNPLSGPNCGGTLEFKTVPGLTPTFANEVTFMGCKPTTLLVENRGEFFEGDILNVRVDVPASARVSGRFDVTSCEASYIRACRPGEGQFATKSNICSNEP